MHIKTPNDFWPDEKLAKEYFEIKVEWLPPYKEFMPPVIAGLESSSSWGKFSYNDVTKSLQGIDISYMESHNLTKEQVQLTWKAKSCKVVFPQ